MKKIAVVTGANKGIGLEICRQLASNAVIVVLTARDEKRGVEAVENLKVAGHSDVVFHQLDLMDTISIASLAEFIKTRFGKLDILVNNAGVSGATVDPEAFTSLNLKRGEVVGAKAHLVQKIVKQTYETAEGCLRTNYYGPKQLTQALIPLLQKSNAARIVNVSSTLGQLKLISNEKAKKELGDADGLTEEKVDEVVKGFLEDVKEDWVETKGWPINVSAYIVSKAARNAYTRVLAKKYPNFLINVVNPGYVQTELNYNTGVLTVEEGAKGPVMLALMPDGGPSGLFFDRMEISSF
ncbi:hypothetical protein L1049_005936 [Liquidambar formosana]|uniref:Short-chain dehydrogenase/reductase n=1 Tax=Liquidambar formosana TaxID=63359 RepID=A0AAP0RGJ2_LIQFO